jgi:hypothetical protein
VGIICHRRRIRYAAIALASALCGNALAADELTDSFVKRLRELNPKVAVTPKADDELQVTLGESSGVIYLGNVRRQCRIEPDRCKADTETLAQSTLRSLGPATPAAVGNLRYVLRPKAYVDQIKLTLAGQEPDAEKQQQKQPLVRRIADDVWAVLVLDSPDSVSPTTLAAFKGQDLTAAQLWDAAAANLLTEVASLKPDRLDDKRPVFWRFAPLLQHRMDHHAAVGPVCSRAGRSHGLGLCLRWRRGDLSARRCHAPELLRRCVQALRAACQAAGQRQTDPLDSRIQDLASTLGVRPCGAGAPRIGRRR